MEKQRIVTLKPCYPNLDPGIISLIQREYAILRDEKKSNKNIEIIPFKTVSKFYYPNEVQEINSGNIDIMEDILSIRTPEVQKIIRRKISETKVHEKIILFFATDKIFSKRKGFLEKKYRKKELVFMFIPGLRFLPGMFYFNEYKNEINYN